MTEERPPSGAMITDPDDDHAPVHSGRRRAWRLRWTPLVTALVVAAVAFGGIVVAALRPFSQPDTTSTAGGATAGTPPLLPDSGPIEPRPLPDMTLPPLAGFGPAGGRDLSKLRGPAVINFWASWCAPCVNEMPTLQRVANDLDVDVIGVDYIDQSNKAKELAERLGIEYELLRDDDGEFGREVDLVGTPTTLLIDARGMIVRRLTGELTEAQMRDAIQAVVGESFP